MRPWIAQFLAVARSCAPIAGRRPPAGHSLSGTRPLAASIADRFTLSSRVMRQSTVKWFDAKKGYGFITHPDDGDDIFVHYSDIESDDDFKTLHADQHVRFELNDGPKGLNASNVVAVDEESSAEAPASNDESTASDEPADPTPEIDPAELDPTAEVDPVSSS